ncbi:trypsin-like peptidase domain-containing protein [Aureimonas phyllosphaerae]|uniref:trypsin-like peptidase domain-containing protein n=1 Tax=Aureimonas phyllosphaerae TaxID=1166078 RepID=UPI003A5BFBFE
MRGVTTAVLAGLLLCAAPVAVTAPAAAATGAEADLATLYNQHTDLAFRTGLQHRLTWTGDYAGPFDGRVGPQTLRAVRDFQARHGLAADGVMDDAFLKLVIEKSDAARDAAGFVQVTDAATGVRLGLPGNVVAPVGETEVGSLWRSDDGGVEIETVRFSKEGYTLDGVFGVLSETGPNKTVSEASKANGGFTIRGHEDGRDFLIRFSGRGGDLRGFSVAWNAAHASVIAPYAQVAAESVEPFAGEPRSGDVGPMARLFESGRAEGVAFGEGEHAKASTPKSESPSLASPSPGFDSSGTGFVVSKDGWLLTNAHVAKACKTVLVGDLGAASKVVVDEDHDLALLKVDAKVGKPLPIVAGKPRLGEDVLALGFPLRSILADSLNVTRGNVSSLMGLMNDANYLQISAPVQPGNSGGPLVDLAGRVVGVVTAKLNAVAVADLTGDIPQSINFAIRPDAAARFLQTHHVAFETADASAPLESVPDATAKVQDSIYPVLCLGSN